MKNKKEIIKMKKRKITYMLVGMLMVGLFSGCNASEAVTDQRIEEDTNREVNASTEALSKECTYDHITFRIGNDWKEWENREGVYVHADGSSKYMILGTSELGAKFDAEEFYSELVRMYSAEKNMIDQDTGEAMKPYVTADGVEGYIGRISMNKKSDEKNEDHFDVDVLVLPTKNYVVTLAAQCDAKASLPLDIREITNTVKIDIAAEQVATGSTFYDKNTDTLLDLTDSDRFLLYLFPEKEEGMYVDGTYEVYRGEEAIKQVSSMKEYGLTQEELEEKIKDEYDGYILNGSKEFAEKTTDDYFVCKDDFYAIVFDIEKYHDENGNEMDNKQETLYIGYYVEELDTLDMMNCKTLSFYSWKRQ